MITAGIDAGSRAIKIVLWDAKGRRALASAIADQGPAPGKLTEDFYRGVLSKQGLKPADVKCTVATGYARDFITSADTTITEITCHARGVHHLLPEARTVVEIGGQDSKLLRLSADGSVRDFAMNDRCAAGTGRFLELVAARLDCSLDDLGPLAARSKHPATISSMCAVFAETEIIGLMASGAKRQDIVAGVQASIASRIASMAGANLAPPIAFTGGVARIAGMEEALRRVLGHAVVIPDQPQFTGALGAALLATQQKGKG